MSFGSQKVRCENSMTEKPVELRMEDNGKRIRASTSGAAAQERTLRLHDYRPFLRTTQDSICSLDSRLSKQSPTGQNKHLVALREIIYLRNDTL